MIIAKSLVKPQVLNVRFGLKRDDCPMIPRDMKQKLLQLATKFPVVSVTGPRQSGKSTLIKNAFSAYTYFSFEDPATRELFQADPKGFLRLHNHHAIFDEAQRVPELFSYLQGMVDECDEPGSFIISGSQNFLLSKGISQSLAGRVGILRLLPLSYREISRGSQRPEHAWSWIYRGGYPRVIASDIDPLDFFPTYIETYLERDVRQELGVAKMEEFSRFIRLCALRSGELLNVTGLASDCGISNATANSWLSILSSSYVIHLLRPYSTNQGKRLIKTPKLYFLDSGLLCNLMGIESADELAAHPQRGAIFETAVVSELMKSYLNRGRTPNLSFWRDTNKNEIDVVVEKGPSPFAAIEIKSSSTFRGKYFDVLDRIAPSELGLDVDRRYVVYAGDDGLSTPRGRLVPYTDIPSALGLEG